MRKSDVAEYHFHALELGSLLAERNAALQVSTARLIEATASRFSQVT